jgi:hypothetical protein
VPGAPYAQGGTFALYESVILHDRPVAYWRFETAAPTADTSGNGHTLTAVGTPTNATGLISAGNGRDFSGSGQAYTAADDDALDGDIFTLEAWIDLDSVTGNRTLFSKGTNGLWLYVDDGVVKLDRQGTSTIAAATVTLSVNTTYFIACSKDGEAVHIYVDGVDVTDDTSTLTTLSSTATALNIARKSDNTELLDGVIDEAVFFGYALTPDQVTSHYEAGSGEFGHTIRASMPSFKIEVAFDTAWNSDQPQWEDVTEFLRLSTDVVSLTQSGRTDETQRPAPASGSMTLGNRDRRFDPDDDTGPYGTNVLPMRLIRARAAWDGALYWLLQGWVESWPPTYPASGYDAVTKVDVVDFFSVFAAAEFPLETDVSEELAGARIASCLDYLSIPENMRNLDDGISLMPAIEGVSGKILDHVLSVAESDGGFLYIGPDGRVVYEDRQHRFEAEALTRGDIGMEAGEVPYRDLDRSKDTAYLFNHAQITSGDDSGTAEVLDQSSVDAFGPRAFTKSFLTGYNECLAAGEWYIYRYKEPSTRFSTVSFLGENNPDLHWPVLLEAYNSNRFTFLHRPLDSTAIEQDAFIERISHQFGLGGWATQWLLSPFGEETPWELDDASFVLGTNTTPTW